jgi:hypothetical protein
VRIAHLILCNQLIVGQEVEVMGFVCCSGSSGVALLLDKISKRQLAIQVANEQAKASRSCCNTLSPTLLIIDVCQHTVAMARSL